MTDAKRCRLYEKGWPYVPAAETNVAATFRRIRREQAKQAEAAKESHVAPFVRPVKKGAK